MGVLVLDGVTPDAGAEPQGFAGSRRRAAPPHEPNQLVENALKAGWGANEMITIILALSANGYSFDQIVEAIVLTPRDRLQDVLRFPLFPGVGTCVALMDGGQVVQPAKDNIDGDVVYDTECNEALITCQDNLEDLLCEEPGDPDATADAPEGSPELLFVEGIHETPVVELKEGVEEATVFMAIEGDTAEVRIEQADRMGGQMFPWLVCDFILYTVWSGPDDSIDDGVIQPVLRFEVAGDRTMLSPGCEDPDIAPIISKHDEDLAEREATLEMTTFTIEAQLDGSATGTWRGMPVRFEDVVEVQPAD